MKFSLKKNLKQIASVTKLKDYKTEVGWFEDTKYDDNLPIAQVAYWQEYGTSKGIPQRPFMRPAEMENESKWEKIFEQEAQKSIETDGDIKKAMDRLGFVVQGDIQQAIIDIHEPALAKSTIKSRQRRGNSSVKPLVDTGEMLATVQHKVSPK